MKSLLSVVFVISYYDEPIFRFGIKPCCKMRVRG